MAAPNRLARETSPYLLQHAHNPVDWYPWGDEAFERARRENKPVLVSIGYSSCHWCHVMERESFDNPAIAELMNSLFVNVKVDREERPDVDDVYMKAVQLLTRHGGWPLTVFLTPDREPFHGGTYFPPVDRHGLPAFPRVLRAVADAFRERPDEVAKATSQLREGIVGFERVEPGPDAPDGRLALKAAEALLSHVDHENGGLGGAPKFPHSQAFQLFLRQHRATGRREFLDAVTLTCSRMVRGGLYDQIGGGFHRYSVDARWLVPHFEKMLYDNAQIPRLLLEAFQVTGDPELGRAVEETLDYVLAEMRHPEGAFFCATDADSEGAEGKYFVWTPAEVRTAVDAADLDLVCRYWDITDEGNFEGHNIPHVTISIDQVARMFGRTPGDAWAALRRARTALYAARARRVPPLRDEKVLAAWNGLMIGTMAEAGRVLGAERFVRAARDAGDFVWTHMHRAARLLHVWAAGSAKQEGFLDDHALLLAGLLDLFEASGDRQVLERAIVLAGLLDEWFHDPVDGGYFFTPRDGESLLARSKPGADGSLPSGNAVAAHALLRLHHMTGDDLPRQRAEEILRLFFGAAARNPFGYATYLQALELWTEGPTEVVVVGAAGAPDTTALLAEAARVYLPHRVIVRATPGDRAPLAPARDRPLHGSTATAYVCRNFACSAPVNEPAALAALLR